MFNYLDQVRTVTPFDKAYPDVYVVHFADAKNVTTSIGDFDPKFLELVAAADQKAVPADQPADVATPAEPTSKMIDAGVEAIKEFTFGDDPSTLVVAVFKAMQGAS